MSTQPTQPTVTIEQQMAEIQSRMSSLQKAVQDEESGAAGKTTATETDLTARVDRLEKDFAAFKQQLHDAGIRLID